MKTSKLILATLLSATAAMSVEAYEQGDVLLRVGATHVVPDDGATPDDVMGQRQYPTGFKRGVYGQQ